MLIRVGFAVLVLGSGIGFFLYIAAFLLMSRDDGGPGYAEQWTGRRFDAQTVLALLTAVLAFGLMMNLVSDTVGPGTVVVGTVVAIALLAARRRGVDLLAVARSLPDRRDRAAHRAHLRHPRRGGRDPALAGRPARRGGLRDGRGATGPAAGGARARPPGAPAAPAPDGVRKPRAGGAREYCAGGAPEYCAGGACGHRPGGA